MTTIDATAPKQADSFFDIFYDPSRLARAVTDVAAPVFTAMAAYVLYFGGVSPLCEATVLGGAFFFVSLYFLFNSVFPFSGSDDSGFKKTIDDQNKQIENLTHELAAAKVRVQELEASKGHKHRKKVVAPTE